MRATWIPWTVFHGTQASTIQTWASHHLIKSRVGRCTSKELHRGFDATAKTGNRRQTRRAWSPDQLEIVNGFRQHLRRNPGRMSATIKLMAVQVNKNDLPDPKVRAAVQMAVLEAMGARSGDWTVSIREYPESPAWHITIGGPNSFHRTVEFFGPVEQNAEDGYAFIKQTLSNVFPMLYLESLHLKDFRCFDQLDLRFDRPSSLEGRWTCIAGINGAGKSSVLQALGLALLGNPLAIELGGERLSRMRRLMDNRKRAEIKITLNVPEGGRAIPLQLEIDESRVVAPGSPYSGVPSWEGVRHLVVVGYGATRNLSPRVDSGSENLSRDVRRQITLFDPLSQLAGAEVLLAGRPISEPFLELFENLLQQVFGSELQILSRQGIRFTVERRDVVEAVDLPDGFRSATAWIADLCSSWCEKAPTQAVTANPADIQAIVLIDEIDLHLHPSLQRALVPRLRKALPKVQWVVTTHSPLVLANFDANEIIALDRDYDGNIRELDRQILGFTSDQIYEWLMGTRPMGAEMGDKLLRSDEGLGKDEEEVARLMRVSPDTDGETAQRQVAEFRKILKTLKR
jgi:hypothetical protein